MKLFVIAAFVAVAAAGRLEHLERSYLPPHGSNGVFGSLSSHRFFGANSGGFGTAGAGLHGHNAGGNFAGATSNQYLTPNYGSSSSSIPQFASALHGFGGQQNFHSQQYSSLQAVPAQQYRASSSQFSSHAGSSFGAPSHQHYSQQSAATSRQYLAPNTGSYQQYPQQAFDEQTGYRY